MTTGAIIVTGGDARYFPLLAGCLRSIVEKPQAAGIRLGVLDCGLTARQADWCREQGAQVVAPGWDLDFPARPRLDSGYQAMTARAFLPRHFPGHGIYLWLDADVWVQDWSSVDLLLGAAADHAVAAVPEIDRSFRNYREAWDEFREVNGAAYREAFGEATGSRLIQRPIVNAGVVAMRAGSPGWRLWPATLADVLARSTNMADQVSLNHAIYEQGLDDARLPAVCNWPVHHAAPVWNTDLGALAEPAPPYQRLGIVHLTLGTKWAASATVGEVSGGRMVSERRLSLRHPSPAPRQAGDGGPA